MKWPFRSRTPAPEPEKKLTINELLHNIAEVHSDIDGVVVTPLLALKNTTVRAIVRAVAFSVATYPVRVMREEIDGEGLASKELLPAHPLQARLRRPNRWQTSFQYWTQQTVNLLLYGESFALKLRGQTGPVLQLQPIDPAIVDVEQGRDLAVTYTVRFNDTETREYSQDQIHHVVGLSTDGLRGRSPLSDCSRAVSLSLVLEQFAAGMFGNSARPGVVIKRPGHFENNEAYSRFKQTWDSAYGKGGRGGTVILEDNWDIESLQMTLVDAQTLDMRKFQRNEIAAIYGVPAYVVGDLEKSSYNNIEQQSRDYIQSAVLPWVRSIEAALERDLLTDRDRSNGVIVRFDLDEALRGDFQSRQTGYKIMREAGVLSANEWRARENMDPRDDEGGSAYIEPMNMRTSAESGTEDDGSEVKPEAEPVSGDDSK